MSTNAPNSAQTSAPQRDSSYTSKRSPSIATIKEEETAKSSNLHSTINTTTRNSASMLPPPKKSLRLLKGECSSSTSSSHTQFYKKCFHDPKQYERITTDMYFGKSESLSGSTSTYGYVHGPGGKQYTEKGQLKRNLVKELDPLPLKPEWNKCPPSDGWELAEKLAFLVKDPVGSKQTDRLKIHLTDFARVSRDGFKIETLDHIVVILGFMLESVDKLPFCRDAFIMLAKNIEKPVMLTKSSDVIKYFDSLKTYMAFLGYLLIRAPDDDLFEVVSKGVIYQLTASDKQRGLGGVHRKHSQMAARKFLADTVVRMLAIAKHKRFGTYLEVAFILIINSVDNCIDFMKENIIENIFYRFNPYFARRKLPVYDINPMHLDHPSVVLGDSSIHITAVLSLLLVLLKTTKKYLEENPTHRHLFPCPDSYSQRCFVWAYRYECRAREHRHQRTTLTVIANIMLHIYGDKLDVFSNVLMPDVLTLSVLTELPPRKDWTSTVNFNTSQADVHFKRCLINLSVDFLRIFPYNKFMVENRQWVVGLMYLIDPGLCHLRAKWSSVLYSEVRRTALQALLLSINLIPDNFPIDYSMIRRTMWYIEWYCESPFDMSVLYWCVRLVQTAMHHKGTKYRKRSMQELLRTHGVVIFMHLCTILVKQKLPPVQKSQSIIALTLRVLTSMLDMKKKVLCVVYPHLTWPNSINALVNFMMDTIMQCLDKQYNMIADKWLVALLNFIWEAIIWKDDNRAEFIAHNGIYNLLDIITMTKYPIQVIALSLVCDIVRAGEAVGQLVSWRAHFGASYAEPKLVDRGATIATLLAALFERECHAQQLNLDENNVLQDLDYPLIPRDTVALMKNSEFIKSRRSDLCLAACDVAGSRMAKCYAILQMLSEDLKEKVDLADEAYNLYKNVKLQPKDETILLLCSHFLTLKLNQAWMETNLQSPGYTPENESALKEFLHIGENWSRHIRQQQMEIIEKHMKKESDRLSTLYEFLGRVRLNVALDALRDVRMVARSSDPVRISHSLLHDAVHAYHRRSTRAKKIEGNVISTYRPPLDDQNVSGKYLKVYSIPAKVERKISKLPPNSATSLADLELRNKIE